MNLSSLNCYLIINPVPNEAPRNVCDEYIQKDYFAFVDAGDEGVAFKCRDFDRVASHMHVITCTNPWIRCHIY